MAFVFPILVMMSCSGFNSGNMAVQHCTIDLPIIKSIAGFYYRWLLISSYVLLIPIFAYITGIILLTEIFLWVLKLRKPNKQMQPKKIKGAE